MTDMDMKIDKLRELKAKAEGVIEAADLIKAHRNAAPKFYWERDEKALFNKIGRLLRDHASKLTSTE